MVIEISVGAVAIAIVILVIFVIFTLRNVSKTLFQLRQTANMLENDTHEVLTNANRFITETHSMVVTNANGLITETRSMVAHVKTKTEHTDALFKAVDQIGKQVNEVSACVSKAAEQHKEKLGGLLAVVGAVMNLAQEWRKTTKKGE